MMGTGDSKHQKTINRLHKIIEFLQLELRVRKQFARDSHGFVEMLLRENRITKDEVKQHFKSRKCIKEQLKTH